MVIKKKIKHLLFPRSVVPCAFLRFLWGFFLKVFKTAALSLIPGLAAI